MEKNLDFKANTKKAQVYNGGIRILTHDTIARIRTFQTSVVFLKQQNQYYLNYMRTFRGF